ncbi:bifunctional hydroxymethylpyrimidine kinase/phosphomethylpyrimidine kinase [Hydrogenovibrio kuenenii]|uniref:bifunctional hydroxymethylpyrimidine kinase/phosphomethylpyrimidine kinase n=1 Tax=Hydrogenovibrio kuenenii TaxID=63658 RepID=UPI0004639D92|nr:bifunctional hydroxymethylpyrimidine kinase/phosphomethylpyrimidine kinase [Hydrogenovibrio kuenenii]
MTKTPVVLTIAGSDPYGGAGIQVDAKTIHALGGYALSVPTALTAQNSQGVFGVFPTAVEALQKQLEVLLDDVEVDAVKIGMLANAEVVHCVAEILERYSLKNIVLDTVLVSSSGRELLSPDALAVLIKELFPRVDVITPNLPELNSLLTSSYLGLDAEMNDIANQLWQMNVKAAVIKGGHSVGDDCTDYLLQPQASPEAFYAERVRTSHTHGTGCVLSSAIATYLAKGKPLSESIQIAKAFLTTKLKASDSLKLSYRQISENRRESIF